MKTKIYVSGELLPSTIQTNIMSRFMSNSQLESFWKSYKGSKKERGVLGAVIPPTEHQEMAVKEYLGGARSKDVKIKYGMNQSEMTTAIRKVSLWHFRNSQA